MNNRIVYDAVLKYASFDRKRTPSGWMSFNGPCCIHNKQSKSDTKKRCGVLITPEGITAVNCFNCGYTALWSEGKNLSNKFEKFFEWAGMPQEELKKLEFKIWQLKENAPKKIEDRKIWINFNFPEKSLPKNAEPFSYWLTQESFNSNFLKVIDYMAGRGDYILTARDYYWTPEKELNRHVIVPFYWDNKIVGWTARATYATKFRYLLDIPTHYMFNTESIKNEHKFIIVVEGTFDAIAIDGIGMLGDHISSEQCQWLNNTGKKIIVLPDREKEGGKLVDIALRENWYVSFPKWDIDIKDAADASKKYGKLYTLFSVINAKTNNKLDINIRRKMDLKHKKIEII
jgi:hypothetical protein